MLLIIRLAKDMHKKLKSREDETNEDQTSETRNGEQQEIS